MLKHLSCAQCCTQVEEELAKEHEALIALQQQSQRCDQYEIKADTIASRWLRFYAHTPCCKKGKTLVLKLQIVCVKSFNQEVMLLCGYIKPREQEAALICNSSDIFGFAALPKNYKTTIPATHLKCRHDEEKAVLNGKLTKALHLFQVCMNSADCSGFRVVGDKRNLLEFTIARV